MTSMPSTKDFSTNGNDGETINSVAHNGRVHNIEAEYNKIRGRNGWHILYQEIREKCERESNEKHYSTSESEKPRNRCLNRYRDVNPYDHSRIILHRGTIDYINANLVKCERAERKYILTQGPLSDTVGHFWLMVWEQNTKAILMLNKLMEKKQVKCHQYWPNRKGPENAFKLSEVNLSVEYLRCEDYTNFCRRWFKLTDLVSSESREIIQFHYTTWPDFGIPSSPVAFLQFLKQVRDSGALSPDVGPAVVHCSAGIGRSGTFCLVDCCLVLIEKEGENKVSVQDVLYELRRYRMGLIQTPDQLYFSYQAIIKGISLLKDPAFLDYKEVPFILNDQKHDAINLDDIPPPLPPRTHSLLPLAGSGSDGSLTLNIKGTHNKPLPKIPTSESFSDDLYSTADYTKNEKDALNNFINTEKSSEMHNFRPLPALPMAHHHNHSLQRVHESESDGNEIDEDDDNDDDYTYDGSDPDDVDNDDDVDEEGNHSLHEHGQRWSQQQTDDTISRGSHKSSNQDLNVSPSRRETEGDLSKEQSLTSEQKLANGIDATNSSNPQSPETELKHRTKRVERQAVIEQKVNEIKRKQREAEERKLKAKKRRSFVKYLAAGVFVGVLCVYAYSKLT